VAHATGPRGPWEGVGGMMRQPLILAINPGSTSTKIALFRGDEKIFAREIRHSSEELARFRTTADQFPFRLEMISRALSEAEVDLRSLAAVVGRGGLTRPIPGGVYLVDDEMVEELLQEVHGSHASNLGAPLAREFANRAGVSAYIVDSIAVDELDPVARISGLPEIERRSVFHALNQKRRARQAAAELGKRYEEVNLIVAHMGGGITVGAHRKGRVVDVNNGVDGEGPMTPERSGGLPAAAVAELAVSGRYTLSEMLKRITGRSGLVAYFGTNDTRAVEAAALAGDSRKRLVLDAMIYQIAREIGACAAVLCGEVDAIVLTGGLAHSRYITDQLERRVGFIAPVFIYPGEDEMAALVEGVLRVLRGEEKVRRYGSRGQGGGAKQTFTEHGASAGTFSEAGGVQE